MPVEPIVILPTAPEIGEVVVGGEFTASLVAPGQTLTYPLGARVEVPITRAVATAWVPATLNGSVWSVTLESPVTAGEFNLVWRTSDPEPPQYEVFVPLFVVAVASAATVGGIDYPPVDVAAVTPTVDDVAAIEQSRCRDEAGLFYPTFTDQTVPSAAHVSVLIAQATRIVLSQLRKDFDPAHYPQVKEIVVFLAAILLEGSDFRNQNEQGNSTTGVWRSLYTQALTGLQGQIQVDVQQSLVITGMEPRILGSSIPYPRDPGLI